jgi:hypothetical protein
MGKRHRPEEIVGKLREAEVVHCHIDSSLATLLAIR